MCTHVLYVCMYVCVYVRLCACAYFDINEHKFDANMAKSVRYHFVANMCTCKNGVPQLGAHCPVNGAARCLSCNSGWTISQDGTKCICTCELSPEKQCTSYHQRFALSFCSEFLYMQEWTPAKWFELPCERRCEMCLVQHRIHSQPRQNGVHWYVSACCDAWNRMT